LDALAWAWKRHYNTTAGDGTVEQFKAAYVKYVLNGKK
jgi:hypothetical protein